jgi:hypothetical protein
VTLPLTDEQVAQVVRAVCKTACELIDMPHFAACTWPDCPCGRATYVVETLLAITDLGLAIVPREPTQEMIEAAWADALDENAGGVWAKMVEAAAPPIRPGD